MVGTYLTIASFLHIIMWLFYRLTPTTSWSYLFLPQSQSMGRYRLPQRPEEKHAAVQKVGGGSPPQCAGLVGWDVTARSCALPLGDGVP